MAIDREPDRKDLPTEQAVQQDFSIPEDADYVPGPEDEARPAGEGKG